MEATSITITIEQAPSIPDLKIITIRGSFDTVTSKQVDEKVLPIIEKEKSNIILDISNLEYLSSIGMLRLINYFKFMSNEMRLLKFVKPPKHIYNTLGAAGIAKYFDIFDNLEAAISSF
jgi:anti-anti-sigma factor